MLNDHISLKCHKIIEIGKWQVIKVCSYQILPFHAKHWKVDTLINIFVESFPGVFFYLHFMISKKIFGKLICPQAPVNVLKNSGSKIYYATL